MFPKAIQNIIETYAMDMALCEEMEKIKIKSNIRRLGDITFLVKLMEKTHIDLISLDNADSTLLVHAMLQMVLDGSLRMEEVVQVINESSHDWNVSPAGWCVNNLEDMYYKRCLLWEKIGIEQYWADRRLIRKWIKASKYLKATQYFCFELMEHEEKTIDDYLIGPMDEL